MTPTRAPRRPLVGVLAVQGAFAEHSTALESVGSEPREVRRAEELAMLDGLVIPGGESTTLSLVAGQSGLLGAVRDAIADGLSVFGTCAGLIMLAREIVGGDQPLIGGMDILVRRNAYGRQKASFEADLTVAGLGPGAFPGVFIRAPWIESTGPAVDVLCEHGGRIVAARQGRLLVTAFHPELTTDSRMHRLFVEGLRSSGRSPADDAEGRTHVGSQ